MGIEESYMKKEKMGLEIAEMKGNEREGNDHKSSL